MVFYYTSNVVEPDATIYVGKDKFENEELIKYGWDEDFHADNLSSAHIYLRLETGQTWDKIPKALLEDCAQLTKAGSIEGNKRDNVAVIYTPWSNLRKDGSMAIGQVSFHNPKLTRKLHIPTRLNPILNRLKKTMTEIPPPESSTHLREAKEAHLADVRKEQNAKLQKEKKELEKVARQRREEKLRGEVEWDTLYGDGRVAEEGVGNWEGFDEDDFM
ncbi:MAG: hypothetical protein MMC33_005113 [Icmadophila ericetorum]|nr:hypothetical protein [Icmadophila ericetorum]